MLLLRHGPSGGQAETMAVADADLACAAIGGDARCLGALLQRHHGALLGLAVTLVGRDDAHDVVHDAFLVALRHIGELREPAAAGAWLRAIVRTQGLIRLRARREEIVDDVSEVAAARLTTSPEEATEQMVLRDWTWAAIERLSEPLRLVTLLRHFGARCSYQEIAAILSVPVGTVRSRLNQARQKLADELLKEASKVHADAGRRQAAIERYYGGALEAMNRGDTRDFAAPLLPEVVGSLVGNPGIRGREPLVQSLHDDTPAMGVRVSLERAIASASITVLELRLENPPDIPKHCPPWATQIHYHPSGPTERIVFAFSSTGASAP